MKLKRIVKQFVESKIDKEKPLLVGLSGGPDSRALFELLKEFPIAAAHVDHGWREESKREAEELKQIVEKEGIPFHLKRLEKGDDSRNLEERCRQERLRFFSELCSRFGYQGVALAHHADDQAETVLKRLFEGASFPLIGSIKAVTEIEGLMIYRPLLELKKSEIEEFLIERGIETFDDVTNRDRRFLRGRLREDIFPYLEEHFGKKIRSNLTRLADEANLLRDFIHLKVTPYRQRLVKEKGKLFLDLEKDYPEHPYLLKQVVRMVGKTAKLNLSNSQIESVCQLLEQRVAGKRVETADGVLHIGRRRLDVEMKMC